MTRISSTVLVYLSVITLANAGQNETVGEFVPFKSVATSYKTLDNYSKSKCLSRCMIAAGQGMCTLAGYNLQTKTCRLSLDTEGSQLTVQDANVGVIYLTKYVRKFTKYVRKFTKYVRKFTKYVRKFTKYVRKFTKYVRKFTKYVRKFTKYVRKFTKYVRSLSFQLKINVYMLSFFKGAGFTCWSGMFLKCDFNVCRLSSHHCSGTYFYYLVSTKYGVVWNANIPFLQNFPVNFVCMHLTICNCQRKIKLCFILTI